MESCREHNDDSDVDDAADLEAARMAQQIWSELFFWKVSKFQ